MMDVARGVWEPGFYGGLDARPRPVVTAEKAAEKVVEGKRAHLGRWSACS